MEFKDLNIKICDSCGTIEDDFYKYCYLGFFQVCKKCYDFYEAEYEKTHECQEHIISLKRSKWRKIKDILLTPLKLQIKESYGTHI